MIEDINYKEILFAEIKLILINTLDKINVEFTIIPNEDETRGNIEIS